MIEVNIWKDRIIKCVLTKFDRLIRDNDGDTVISCDAIDYHTIYFNNYELYQFGLLCQSCEICELIKYLT